LRRQSAKPSQTQSLLVRAVDAHKAGRLDEAKQLYLDILAIDLQHARSLYGLGLIAHQAGNLEVAARMMQRALAASPGDTACRRSYAAVLREQGKDDLASAEYESLLRIAPDDEAAHFNLADILRKQGRLAEAETHFKRAIELRPDSGENYENLAAVFKRQGRFAEARTAYEHALAQDPKNVTALQNLGNLLVHDGELDAALLHFDRALALAPDLAEAHNGKGAALHELGQLEEAETCYRKALTCKPDFADAHCNLGNLERKRGQLAEAKQHYERALELNPELSEAHSNLAIILVSELKLADARAHYDRALATEPGSIDARWNHSLLDLLEGKFEAGWKDYEVRQSRRGYAPRSFPGPLWRGEALDGARILLHSEQGLGDTVQFLRYVPLVQAAGGRVILDIQKPMRSVAALLPDVKVRDDAERVDYEWQCPLMSLPHALHTALDSIPSQTPYLTVPQAAMESAAGLQWPAQGLRVGIVWSGNPEHREDRFRSIPLALLHPLLQKPGAHFFSLQMGSPAAQLVQAPTTIVDLQSAIHDMADTAALLTHLDLVLTVDTAVAHLAGALGRPTWVLLPFSPDWRWLLGREDSPWYPTMRLFRQPAPRDWKAVAQAVSQALDKELA
jgi:tetratricopeptide (TPR) repeat protein